MENVQPGDAEPATGPAVAIEQMPEDPYPSGVVFQVWSLFVRAILYGAGLGMLVIVVATVVIIPSIQPGRTEWMLALPAFLFFGGLAGAVVGAVAATGALIAVLVFAPFAPTRGPAHPITHQHSGVGRGQAQRRALVSGVGAAVLVCAGWIVFVVFVRSEYSPILALLPAVIGGAVSGGLAWSSVRRWERAQLGRPSAPGSR